MINSFLWSALLVAIGLINYTSCIIQMNSPVSHAQHGFLLVSSKGQIPNDTGDVGTAANDSRSCFTLTIPGCHHTILVPNPAKIFLGRYMAALNAGANNIFCCFTNMDFVVSILLKVFSSVWLSYMPRVIWRISSSVSLGKSGTTSLASIFSHAYVLRSMPSVSTRWRSSFGWRERDLILHAMARSSLLFPVLSGGEYLLQSAETMRT